MSGRVLAGDETRRMQDGVRDWVRRAGRHAQGGVGSASPAVLLSALCASAFCPLLMVGGVAGAGVAVLSSVGGGFLTQVISDALDRMRQHGKGPMPPRDDLEAGIAGQIQRVLAAGGEQADALRGEIAAVLREIDAGGTALRAALEESNARARDDVIAAIGVLSSGFGELGFLIKDVAQTATEIQKSLDIQGADVRTIMDQNARQATDIRLVREDIAVIAARARVSQPPGRVGDDLAPRWAGACPYRGLLPFDESDAEVFYGRERLAAELAVKLATRVTRGGLIVVTGASGAGKSSLLRAGLLPILARGQQIQGSAHWPRAVMTPTKNPLTELAARVAAVGGNDAVTVRDGLIQHPDQTHLAIWSALLAVAARHHEGSSAPNDNGVRLVLVVDQFEQVFTLNPGQSGEARRRAFVTALCAAATKPVGPQQEPPALVVIAVRGDFWDRCAAYPELVGAMQDGQFVVGPMNESELTVAINGPAEVAGLRIDRALTDTILSDLRTAGSDRSAGVLPLLSQAMALTWEKRDGDRLTSRGYSQSGGLSHAVQTGADKVYDALPAEQQVLAREMLRGMTVVGRDSRLTRRPLTRADLYSEFPDTERSQVDAVLEAFAAERLIVLNENAAQISHDALLQAWPKLRAWLEEDQASWMTYGQLADAATAWHERNNDPSFLYRGSQLTALRQAVTQWSASPERYPALTATQRDFLHAATVQARRGRRRWLGAAAVVMALVVAAGTAVGLAQHFDKSAGTEHAIALSRQLAAASLAIEGTDPVTARQLALAAWSVYPTSQAISEVSDDLTEQVTNGYLPADAAGSGVVGLLADSGGVTAVAFSPDGKLLATGGADVRLWDPVTGQPVGVRLGAPGTGTAGLAFSPDGRLLAAADTRGDVRLWHVATRQPAGALLAASPVPGAAQAPTEPLVLGTSGEQVAFSADGTFVASGGSDGYARVWDVTTGRPAGRPIAVDPYAATRSAVHYGVNAVAFSPAGRLLATAAANGYVRLWDPASGTAVGRPMLTAAGSGFGGPDAHALAFSPDGKTLATAGTAVGVQLWSTASHVQVGAPLGVTHHARAGAPSAFAASCGGLAFSPDGKRLACAGSVFGPELIDIVTGQLTNLYPPVVPQGGNDAYDVNAVAFSPAGGAAGGVGGAGLFASGNSNGTATLWDAAAHSVVGAPLSSYPVHAAPVRGIGLASSGQRLDGPYSNGYVHLIASPALSGAGRDVLGLGGMTFSPDGMLAAAPAGHYLRLLDTRTAKTRLRLLAASGNDTVTSALFSPDGGIVASVDRLGTVRLWNTATGAVLGGPLAVSSGGGDLGLLSGQPAMAFSPDGRLLALASMDGYVSLVSTATGLPDGAPLPVDPVPRPAHASAGNGQPGPRAASGGARIDTVAFSPDGRLLAAAGADGYIRMWLVSTRRPAYSPIPAAIGVGVRSVAFSPARTVLASVAGDGSLRLWDPASGTPVGLPLSMGTSAPVSDPVLTSFSPDGGLIALMDSTGNTVAWPEWLVAHPHQALCEQVGPPPSYVWSKYASGESEPGICP
jgi:WD40 repeat protein